MQIVPALLAKTPQELILQFNKVANLGDLISYDVADGNFAEGFSTPGPAEFPKPPSGKRIFWHLMVNNPKDYIDECLLHQTQIIAVHVESRDVDLAINRIKENNIVAGLVFNPDTNPMEWEYLIKQVEVVQIMTVIPGAQGRGFDSRNLDKIDWIRSINPSIKIAIDGGINPETMLQIIYRDPNFVIVGSFLTEAEDPKYNFNILNK